ncbi:unnamed protein product, partial [Cylicocyclus nassatus]
MSERSNGGVPGPSASDNAVYVVDGPSHEQEVRALAILAIVVIGFLAIIALLYTIRWVCLLMKIRRESEKTEAAEAESSLHGDTEPADEDVISGLTSESESAKRCYPSTEKMIELMLFKKTPEKKKEGVTLGTMKPCPDYSQIAFKNEQMYIGGLSKRPKEPPGNVSTLETPYAKNVGQLPQTAGENAILSAKSPPKKSQEVRNAGAAPVLADTDQVPLGVPPRTQLPLGKTQLSLAPAGIVSTPVQQPQLNPQSRPYTGADMMIVGQSSARSASSTDGINADARVADAGVKITGAAVSIKPMRHHLDGIMKVYLRRPAVRSYKEQKKNCEIVFNVITVV